MTGARLSRRSSVADPRHRSPTPAVPDTTAELDDDGSLVADGEARAVRPAGGARRRDRAALGFELKDTATGGASDANTTSGHGRAVDRRPRPDRRERPLARRSTSRSTRSCRGRRSSRGCCWRSARDPVVTALASLDDATAQTDLVGRPVGGVGRLQPSDRRRRRRAGSPGRPMRGRTAGRSTLAMPAPRPARRWAIVERALAEAGFALVGRRADPDVRRPMADCGGGARGPRRALRRRSGRRRRSSRSAPSSTRALLSRGRGGGAARRPASRSRPPGRRRRPRPPRPGRGTGCRRQRRARGSAHGEPLAARREDGPVVSTTTIMSTAARAASTAGPTSCRYSSAGFGSRSIAGREQPDRSERVGDREHQHRERNEVGAHERPRRRAGPALNVCRHRRSGRPTPAVPSGAVSWALDAGTSRPTAGPTIPPAMIPMVGAIASETPTPPRPRRARRRARAGR